MLALERKATGRPTKRIALKKMILFCLTKINSCAVKKRFKQLYEQHVGPTSKFANLKVINSLVNQQQSNFGPTLIIPDNVL